jgi:uncharacterized protein (TIGR02001 family)
MRKSLLLVAILGTFAAPVAVMAEEAAAAPTPTWTFPASATVVSDYIWRGQSQTWGNPAVQFGIEADHASGFYAGFWGSNVSSHWLPNANLEMDFSAGFRNTFMDDFKYDIGAVYVYYPDGNFNKSPASAVFNYKSNKLDTLELYASLGWKWFALKGGINPTEFYGWDTTNSLEGVGNFGTGNTNAGLKPGSNTRGSGYIMASASYDVMEGFNVAGEVGRQMISDSTGLDWTWYKLGATKSFAGGWSVNAFYTGTAGSKAYEGFASFDTPNAPIDRYSVDKNKVVVGISKAF